MFGDRYIIRGQQAKSDTFVDGLRDPGMTIRESFAIEQLEITKGPSSSFAGRGSAGGAINAITKRATTDYSFIKGDGSCRHGQLLAHDAGRQPGADRQLRRPRQPALQLFAGCRIARRPTATASARRYPPPGWPRRIPN